MEDSGSGAFTIQEAAKADFPAISDFLALLRFGPRKTEWLSWKYLENPEGLARIFLLINENGNIKGLLAYMPRHFAVSESQPTVIMQAVDGILAPDVRGKRLYPKLLQYSMSKIQHPLIGFPNQRAEDLHLRCNWSLIAPEERWVFPCAIGNRLSGSRLRFSAPLFNFASNIYATALLGRSPYQISMKSVRRFQHDHPMDATGLTGVRTADYLNWRFIDNPMRQYWCHEYFDGTECIGYSAYGRDGSCGELFDFVSDREHKKCLRLLVEHCRGLGISHLLFRGVGLNLCRYGFLKRRGPGSYISSGLPKDSYILTLCDSDW